MVPIKISWLQSGLNVFLVGSFHVLFQSPHKLFPQYNSLWLICSFLFQGQLQLASSEASCARGEAWPCLSFMDFKLAQLLSCENGFSSVFHKSVFGWAPFITIFNNLHLWRYFSPKKSLLKWSARPAN